MLPLNNSYLLVTIGRYLKIPMVYLNSRLGKTIMRKRQKSKEEVRDEAVEILYNSLKAKQPVSKEECYEIYDRMQKEASVSREEE